MFKYILIIAIGFGAYKALLSPEGFLKSGGNEISSSEYKFEVIFPSKPNEKVNTIELPKYGKFKTTSYYVRKPDLACVVVVSDYLEQDEIPGDIYDQIHVAERHLLKGYGGSIDEEEFIYNGNVSGYKFDMTTRDNKLLQSRIFNYENNSYNLTCQYKNSDEYKVRMNDFMDSFVFI